MTGSNIILILVIIASLAIFFSVAVGEEFCNCYGLGWNTTKPTYYMYRPIGDVSSYGAGQPQPTVGSLSYPEQNLGWRTGMPYDYFEAHMKNNNWVAGADPSATSVPEQLSVSTTRNGGYMKNYGSPAKDYAFVYGPHGYPNMLSDGTPQFEGPAGSFSDTGCPYANAYNLGVGVL